MLGAIIGDIVGSRFEFRNTDSEDFDLFTEDCSFTDDSICTMAVADAILRGAGYGDSLRKWCRNYPYPVGGYGISFAHWVRSDNPQPYNSFGNGSAMRVSPVGFWFDDAASVLSEAGKSASVTHNHPEGIKGAQVIAMCIYMLRNGAGKAQIEKYVRREYGGLPSFEPFSNPFDETCMNAVPVSVSCFLHSTDFESAVRNAITVGGDSDTIGAITGSLAEAMYGIPHDIRRSALSYLTDDMLRIVENFYKKLNHHE